MGVSLCDKRMVMFSVNLKTHRLYLQFVGAFFGLKPSHVLVFCVFVPAEFTKPLGLDVLQEGRHWINCPSFAWAQW